MNPRKADVPIHSPVFGRLASEPTQCAVHLYTDETDDLRLFAPITGIVKHVSVDGGVVTSARPRWVFEEQTSKIGKAWIGITSPLGPSVTMFLEFGAANVAKRCVVFTALSGSHVNASDKIGEVAQGCLTIVMLPGMCTGKIPRSASMVKGGTTVLATVPVYFDMFNYG